MRGFYCPKCDVSVSHGGVGLCGARGIPIATICNPPEPTVIEASDLAPGMVVVAVDADPLPLCAFVCTPDAMLTSYGSVWALRMELDDAAWVAEGDDP